MIVGLRRALNGLRFGVFSGLGDPRRGVVARFRVGSWISVALSDEWRCGVGFDWRGDCLIRKIGTRFFGVAILPSEVMGDLSDDGRCELGEPFFRAFFECSFGRDGSLVYAHNELKSRLRFRGISYEGFVKCEVPFDKRSSFVVSSFYCAIESNDWRFSSQLLDLSGRWGISLPLDSICRALRIFFTSDMTRDKLNFCRNLYEKFPEWPEASLEECCAKLGYIFGLATWYPRQSYMMLVESRRHLKNSVPIKILDDAVGLKILQEIDDSTCDRLALAIFTRLCENLDLVNEEQVYLKAFVAVQAVDFGIFKRDLRGVEMTFLSKYFKLEVASIADAYYDLGLKKIRVFDEPVGDIASIEKFFGNLDYRNFPSRSIEEDRQASVLSAKLHECSDMKFGSEGCLSSHLLATKIKILASKGHFEETGMVLDEGLKDGRVEPTNAMFLPLITNSLGDSNHLVDVLTWACENGLVSGEIFNRFLSLDIGSTVSIRWLYLTVVRIFSKMGFIWRRDAISSAVKYDEFGVDLFQDHFYRHFLTSEDLLNYLGALTHQLGRVNACKMEAIIAYIYRGQVNNELKAWNSPYFDPLMKLKPLIYEKVMYAETRDNILSEMNTLHLKPTAKMLEHLLYKQLKSKKLSRAYLTVVKMREVTDYFSEERRIDEVVTLFRRAGVKCYVDAVLELFGRSL